MLAKRLVEFNRWYCRIKFPDHFFPNGFLILVTDVELKILPSLGFVLIEWNGKLSVSWSNQDVRKSWHDCPIHDRKKVLLHRTYTIEAKPCLRGNPTKWNHFGTYWATQQWLNQMWVMTWNMLMSHSFVENVAGYQEVPMKYNCAMMCYNYFTF